MATRSKVLPRKLPVADFSEKLSIGVTSQQDVPVFFHLFVVPTWPDLLRVISADQYPSIPILSGSEPRTQIES